MDYSSIKAGLEGFVERYDSQTFIGSYRETNRSSLLNDGLSTRANSLWKMAEYVVAKYDNTTDPIDNYIKGWKQLASGANNQYLLIEESKEVWAVYNAQGERLGGEDYIRILFEKKKKQRSFSNNTENGNVKDAPQPLQQIFYGAPGTGKSNEIKRLTGDGTFSKNLTFRTTFHPDSDYSSFVGAYKPIWKDDKIVYDFRPQTFLKAYVAAWTHPTKEVALVIEEINRGNCAQVFGDIFQLLDREKNGLSKYPIEADMDMKDFLKRAFNSGVSEPWVGTFSEDNRDEIDEYYVTHYDNAFEKIKNGEILALPKNLSLLATMNTSDQSLFPMDSAFKRRWSWEYMPINNAHKDWKIQLDNSHELIDWWEFLQRINDVVSDLTTSEDKQLGYFFCQPNDFTSSVKAVMPNARPDLITAKHFVDKVIFYLWNDVFKDYAFDAKCCKGEDEKEILFAKFYNKDDKSVNIDVLRHFFETLKDDTQESLVKIKPANTDSAVSNGETIEEPETQDTTTAEE